MAEPSGLMSTNRLVELYVQTNCQKKHCFKKEVDNRILAKGSTHFRRHFSI